MMISMMLRIARLRTTRGACRANRGDVLTHLGSPENDASRKSKSADVGMLIKDIDTSFAEFIRLYDKLEDADCSISPAWTTCSRTAGLMSSID